MRNFLAALLAVSLLVWIPGAEAQEESIDLQLYMTDGVHPDGGEVLSSTEGTSGATHLFSPLLGGLVDQVGPTSYTWTTQTALNADVSVVGDTDVTIYFDNGVEVLGTTTVTIRAVLNGTAIPFGEATHEGFFDAEAHTETFTLPTDGTTLEAGTQIRLDVSISGLEPDVLVQMQYGDDVTPSGVDRMTVRVVDSDGDGFGDTAERVAGTDPDDAFDYPGAPPRDDLDEDGLKDDWEEDQFGDRNMSAEDDPDADGCDNLCEQTHGTDPNLADTDGDTRPDGNEIDEGTDPLVAEAADPVEDTPEGNREPWLATLFFASSMLVSGFALLGRFT